MPMPPFRNILASSAICLAAGVCVCHAATDRAVLEKAEQHIRLQWQSNPKLRYHALSYKGSLQDFLQRGHFVQKVRTIQGIWISVHELPADTLVFRGEVKGFNPVKTKGGAGYFFCTSETGELVAYLLMK